MSLRAIVAGITWLVCGAVAQAEWKVLLAENNAPAEIAVDFDVESIQIDQNGDAVMVVKSKGREGEIGFTLRITKPSKGEIAQLGKADSVPIWRCDIEIRSIGTPTERLVKALRQQLAGSDQFDTPLGIVAPYSGFYLDGTPDLSRPSSYLARDVGLIFDSLGKTVTGDCFSIGLIVDGPMRSLRAYFSLPGGGGGIPPAQRARAHWRDSKTKKEGN